MLGFTSRMFVFSLNRAKAKILVDGCVTIVAVFARGRNPT